MAFESFEPDYIFDMKIVKAGLSMVVIAVILIILIIIVVSPIRGFIAECCARATNNDNLRSYKEHPAIERALQSRLDRMRGGLRVGILARLRERGA
jgi:hypothetical protein